MDRKQGKLRPPWATATATTKPLARSDDLVVEEVEGELLVYDLASNRAHCLGATAARVWRACDGRTPVGALSATPDVDADSVDRALAELDACDLLDEGPTLGAGTTRRELGIRVAKTSAAVAAVPLIWSIAGPIPEAAATPTPAFCAEGISNGCGNCGQRPGCCCCHFGERGNDKVCYPTSLCPSHPREPPTSTKVPHCSTTGD